MNPILFQDESGYAKAALECLQHADGNLILNCNFFSSQGGVQTVYY